MSDLDVRSELRDMGSVWKSRPQEHWEDLVRVGGKIGVRKECWGRVLSRRLRGGELCWRAASCVRAAAAVIEAHEKVVQSCNLKGRNAGEAGPNTAAMSPALLAELRQPRSSADGLEGRPATGAAVRALRRKRGNTPPARRAIRHGKFLRTRRPASCYAWWSGRESSSLIRPTMERDHTLNKYERSPATERYLLITHRMRCLSFADEVRTRDCGGERVGIEEDAVCKQQTETRLPVRWGLPGHDMYKYVIRTHIVFVARMDSVWTATLRQDPACC